MKRAGWFLGLMLLAALAPAALRAECNGTPPARLNQKDSMILDILDMDRVNKQFAQQADDIWQKVRDRFSNSGLAAQVSLQLKDIQRRCANQALLNLEEVSQRNYSEDEIKALARFSKLQEQSRSRALSAEETGFMQAVMDSALLRKAEAMSQLQEQAVGAAQADMDAEAAQKLDAALPAAAPGPNDWNTNNAAQAY